MAAFALGTQRNPRQILVCFRKPAHPAQEVQTCLVLNDKSSVKTYVLLRNVIISLYIPTSEMGSASPFQLPFVLCALGMVQPASFAVEQACQERL